MRSRAFVFSAALFCTVLCISGCQSPKQESDASVTENPASETDENQIGQDTEIMNAEDQIETVYQNALKSAFCIFTPAGNNGTGFLYRDTYVITNAHVLYEADEFTLQGADGNEYSGTVVFTDDNTDIAVIRAEQIHGDSVSFGNSDEVLTGDMMVMIGNPADGEPFCLCTGRRVELDEDFYQHPDQEEKFIPSDADLASGYSGGPVFNLSGELIGISNAAYIGDLSQYDFDHLSLIIPINRVRQEIEENCAG